MSIAGKDLDLIVQISPIRLASFDEILEYGGKKYPKIAGGTTPKWWANGLKYIASGAVDLDTDTIKLMLVTTTFVPNQGTDTFANAFSANETTGGTSGYPAGGFTLGTLSVAVSSLTMNWDAADISAPIVGSYTFRYGCFYKYRGATMTANEVIGYVDFSTQTISDATLNITLTNPLTIVASP